MKKKRIIIFDTTLRDGEQCPGASMTLREKLEVARQLARLKVDVIEGGFPVISDGDFTAVNTIAREIKGPTVAGLARCVTRDIEAAGKAVAPAGKKGRIHVFLATSKLHREFKLGKAQSQIIKLAVDGVKRARKLVADVEFSPEDASRTEPDFLVEVCQAAVDAGATTLNIPDTVGWAVPGQFAELIRHLHDSVPEFRSGKAIISVHCHNDLGLAVANSLAAVKAGARQVECTVNGLGERAGNAAMEEIVMALRTRSDAMPFTSGVKTENIMKASRLVSGVTGFAVQPNKAIVGANAFAHEAGIHQDGVLKHAGTYEIMTPESVGLSQSKLVLGKHSGRHAFTEKLRELGYDLGDNAVQIAFKRFKDLADLKKDIFDEDIIAMVDDEVVRTNDQIRMISLEVLCGTKHQPPTAELELEVDGETLSCKGTGDGPVDAAFNCIKELVSHQARLQLYQVHAVTGGTDAQAEVTVRLEEEGRTVNGRGADTDTMVASVKAYVNALNKLMVKRQKTAPDALSA